MEKSKFLKKITICLIAISVSAALFAGCQSKDSANTVSAKNNSTTQAGRKKLNPEEIKKQIQEEIQPLIKAGTITQAQADKIVDAMTSRNGGSSGNSNNGSGQNGSKEKQRFNPLSKLVSDGTITQAQADAVMEKMKGNFNRNGNGQQNVQNNNNQSNGSK